MNPQDEAQLSELLDGRLDGRQTRALREQFATDSTLQEAWDEMRRLRALVRADDGLRAPPDFVARVRERISDSEREATRDPRLHLTPRPALRGRGPWLVAAAALLMVGLVLALRQQGGEGPPIEHAALEEEAAPVARDAREPSPGAAVAGAASEDAGDSWKSRGAIASGRGRSPAAGEPKAGARPSAAPRGALRAGDALPPGLRRPSDLSPADLAALDLPVLVFEAPTLQAGYQQLGRALASLHGPGPGAPGDDADAAEAAEAESYGLLIEPPADRRVLATTFQVLTPSEFDRLYGLAQDAARERLRRFGSTTAPATGDEDEEELEARKAGGDAAPPAPSAADPAEVAVEEEAQREQDARAKARKALRVRVVIVESAGPR